MCVCGCVCVCGDCFFACYKDGEHSIVTGGFIKLQEAR